MVSQATVTATTHTFTAADGITASTTYVPSPYGSWLLRSATPNTDTFSGWFVDQSGTTVNYVYKENITLKLVSSSPVTHR